MKSILATIAIPTGSTLAMWALWLAASLPAAEERVSLRPAFREGERWSFQQSADMRQSSTMTAEGQPQGQMQQRLRQSRKGKITILAIRNGLPVSIRITFDNDCGGTMEMAGQQQPVPFPFAGQTITLTRDAAGRVQHDYKGQADPAAIAELYAYLPTREYYPEQPVAVGDRWRPDVAALREQQQLGPQDRLETSCRLVGIKEQGGRRLAEVEMTTTMSRVQGQVEMQSSMRGISLIDIATGNTLQLDASGDSGMKGTQQMPDYSGGTRSVQMTGQGSSEMHLSVSILDQTTNGLPTHAAPVSDAGGAPPEMPSTALSVPSFSGTFTDGQLTITLSGAAGAYTGVLLLGDGKYPVVARAVGGHLDGSFESEGQKFSFRATIQGDTVRLTSDGKTYELKKRATNPLVSVSPSRKPEPQRNPNPLAQGVPGTGQQSAPNAASLRLTKVSVRDPGVNNIEAFSFLVPSGWRTEGGIQWVIDSEVQAMALVKFTDPQTSAAVELLPIQCFVWNPQQNIIPVGNYWLGSIVMPPITDVTQFIQAFYAKSALPQLAGARIAAAEDRPNIAAVLAQAMQFQVGASRRVRYEYTAGGQPWEEDVFVTLVYKTVDYITFWSVASAYTFRAPKGRLDALTPVMNTTMNTMRITPEWYAQRGYMQQMFYDRMRQGIQAAGRLSAHIAANNAEIQQMFADSYRRSQESGDRISRSYAEYIRGVETYRDPFESRQVQLPSGYRGVWVSRTGDYVLSNEAGFDPNVGSNIEWRRLEQAP